MSYKDPIKQKEYSKQYRLSHKEKIKESRKQYRLSHKKQIKEYQKQWCIDNPEYNKEYQKQWCIDNPEYNKEYQKQWCIDNPEYNKEYRLLHREEEKARVKKYQQSPKGKLNVKKHQANRNRDLGYDILNEWDANIKGFVGHHLDKVHVLYIPVEIHKSIKHGQEDHKSMDAINELVYYWYLCRWFLDYYMLSDKLYIETKQHNTYNMY